MCMLKATLRIMICSGLEIGVHLIQTNNWV